MITGEWIKKRLTGQHGEKARLAAAMRISPDKFSKVLNGTREVQPNEVPLVLRFFGFQLAEPVEKLGFAEPPIEPAAISNHRRHALARLLAPQAQSPEVFTASKDYSGFGILTGDLLITDALAKPGRGDLVLVELHDTSMGIETLALRRFLDNFLAEDGINRPLHPLRDGELQVGKLRPLKAVARAPGA